MKFGSACLALTCFGSILAVLFGSLLMAQAPDNIDGELEAFVDGTMAALFEAHRLVGSSVSIVRQGEVALEKGYGYADLESLERVNPGSTLFRIGSVSKLFVWTAVMQFYEQGRLNLDTDLNEYLQEFELPEAFGQPITMRHLFTHTAGFEDRALRLFGRTPEALLPLGRILADDMPQRIRAPGRFAAYSNYGSALAAYVVSELSGRSWEDYLEENILVPLEMSSTTSRQPVPDPLAQDLAVGYQWSGGHFKRSGFEYIPLAPSGSMSSSARDMAKFMLVHLQNGQLDGNRILKESSAREMRDVAHAHDPRLSGIGVGFLIREVNGQQVVSYGGATLDFYTALLMVPGDGFGVFVSFNSRESAGARKEFLDAVLDRVYSPDPPSQVKTLDGYYDRMRRIEGVYRTTRRSATTLDRIGEIAGTFSVIGIGDGRALISDRVWREVEPYVFQGDDENERFLFRWEEDEGRFYAYRSDLPIMAFERLLWFEKPQFHLLVLVVCLLIFLSTFVFPIVALFVWRPERSMLAKPSPSHPLARWLAGLTSLSCVGFLVALGLSLVEPTEFVFGVPMLLRLSLVLPLIGGALTIILLVTSMMAWKGRYWGWGARLHYTLVAAAALIFLWQLSYWNLLGWNLY
jgi:CubicO group peptidase (beta-lactamase class C family)